MSKSDVASSTPVNASSTSDRTSGPMQASTVLVAILTIAWLLVPAVQYMGTLQRTDLRMGRDAVYPQLVTLDLLPVYVALLAASLLYAGWTAWRRRSAN